MEIGPHGARAPMADPEQEPIMKRLVLGAAALLMLSAAFGCRSRQRAGDHAAHARPFGPPRFAGPRGQHHGRFAHGPVTV